jgi:DNA repair protein RadC
VREARPLYRLTIKEMPADERPQEKLKLRGAASLSTGELLAIILRTGLPGETVVDVAQRLLVNHGGLLGLSRADYSDLYKERGLGEVKAAKLLACVELARRLALEKPDERMRIQSPEDIAAILSSDMAALDQEELRVVLLNTKNEVLRVVTVYRGSVNAAQIRVSEVFKEAVRQNAPSLVVAHNHPSVAPRGA